ncbi:MAG: hypothetical protein ABSA80_02615 [Terriglobales bacterium]|jgi:hypothetical protein
MATKKKDVRSWMRKQLGRETADAMLKKLDKMANNEAPVKAIEKTIAEDLSKHFDKVKKYLDHHMNIDSPLPHKGSK